MRGGETKITMLIASVVIVYTLLMIALPTIVLSNGYHPISRVHQDNSSIELLNKSCKLQRNPICTSCLTLRKVKPETKLTVIKKGRVHYTLTIYNEKPYNSDDTYTQTLILWRITNGNTAKAVGYFTIVYKLVTVHKIKKLMEKKVIKLSNGSHLTLSIYLEGITKIYKAYIKNYYVSNDENIIQPEQLNPGSKFYRRCIAWYFGSQRVAVTCVSGTFYTLYGYVWVENPDSWASSGDGISTAIRCCLIRPPKHSTGASNVNAYVKTQSQHLLMAYVDPDTGDTYYYHFFSYIALYVDPELNANVVADHYWRIDAGICTPCVWRSW